LLVVLRLRDDRIGGDPMTTLDLLIGSSTLSGRSRMTTTDGLKNEKRNALLDASIEAHGGLERWRRLDAVSVHAANGGALWALKGQGGVVDDVFVRASLHQERESHHPFGGPDRRSAFTPERVAVEATNGEVIDAMDQPRASFAGHTLETPWTTLQLAYFVGTAMWTYLTQPFTFALPGFETTELDPWQESGEEWRRLQVVWPSYLATHSTEQTLYIGSDGLIRRHDYDVEIAGGSGAAHYMADYAEAAGIMVPTRHRIFPRGPGGEALSDPLLVSIDVDDIAFT
jgi:hypothetical protein